VPRISIITALHNKGPYIAETIQSVLAQTMPDWEMIVVENGSTDNGPEIVKQFSDARIRLVVSPKCGPGAARNFGLGLTTGGWILFLDADDLLSLEYLHERLSAGAHFPDAQIIAGCWQEFSDGEKSRYEHRKPAGWGGDNESILNSAIGSAPWILHAALVRRDWLSPDRCWPELLDRLPSEDGAFWFRLLLGAKVAWSDHPGAIYRMATPLGRDHLRGNDVRFRALKIVIEYNLDCLRLMGMSPNAVQRQTLMRIFEEAYRKALSGNDRETAATSLHEAESWLKSCQSDNGAILLRKMLGLPLFNLIRFGKRKIW